MALDHQELSMRGKYSVHLEELHVVNAMLEGRFLGWCALVMLGGGSSEF